MSVLAPAGSRCAPFVLHVESLVEVKDWKESEMHWSGVKHLWGDCMRVVKRHS